MAYQIVYDLSGQMRRISHRKRRLMASARIVFLIGVIAMILWTAGGDWTVTLTALDTMAENLGQGSSLQQAFSGFCLDILQGA